MFSFNRNEQIAILLLCGALLVGGVVSLVDRYTLDGIPDFDVIKGAVPVPTDTSACLPDTSTGPEGRLPPSRSVGSSRIDLNRASPEDLERLPRIGPQMARRIVDHRKRHGPFRRLEDLTAIRGIGDKTIERLRPLVELTPP